jgi:hypothetical protein
VRNWNSELVELVIEGLDLEECCGDICWWQRGREGGREEEKITVVMMMMDCGIVDGCGLGYGDS